MHNDKIKPLIDAIAENSDQEAFSQLFHHYFPGLLSFANSITKNIQSSEEVVQDVFLKIWENRKTLKSIHSLSNYLYTATRHTALNYIKSKKNTSFEEIGDDFLYSVNTPESMLIHNENITELVNIINTLPPKCRFIFRLVKDEGLTYEQVAQLLQISPRTVNAQMTIALTRLVGSFEKLFPEFNALYSKRK